MFLPVPTMIASLIAITACDLHIVLPGRRALDRKPVTDVDTDMPRQPDCFPRKDIAEVGRLG